MKKSTILKKLEKMSSFTEKLEYLNGLYLKASTSLDEEMILEMIERLKRGF